MKLNSVFSVLLALILALGSLSTAAAAEAAADVSALYKSIDVDDAWSPADAQVIDLDSVQGGTVTISQKGDYVLSGTLNGQILVTVQKEEKVRLILNSVTITGTCGPAIYETQSDKLIITLAEGTLNTLTDGTVITDADDTIGAALYAEDDLSINGTGTLIANGTQKHGIQCKTDLVIANGNITVEAAVDGIRSRNSMLVLDGTLNLAVGGDGLTTTRTNAEGKGWMVLAGGSVTVKTGDGAGTVRDSANSKGFGSRGRKDDWGSTASVTDSSMSQKALKAAADLTILGGTYAIDCTDDGLHGVNVTVSGGTFDLKSGDDGMHADQELTVNGGIIEITQCYEGLEGKNVTVNGGEIRIVSSDDGLNSSGGSDGSGFGGRGRGRYTASGDSGTLTIAGGTIAVTAGGDGLDSNGSIAITGGVTGVWTASAGMEGPIDFNGSGTITGGTLIAATAGGSGGGRGRASAGLSGLKSFAFSASGEAGETITLTDKDGNIIGMFTPENAFSALTVSSSGLDDGSDFTVLVGSRIIESSATADSVSSATAAAPGSSPDTDSEGRDHGRRGH